MGKPTFAVLYCFAALASVHAAGFQGQAFQQSPSGAPIAGVSLTFIRENSAASFSATTDAAGKYSVTLPAARYYWIATHAAFEDNSSAPGFGVVNAGPALQTLNFFLRPPAVTTVIVVRHAEKQDPNSNAPTEPLSTAGKARAQKLRETLFRAGVTAIYSTDTVRTKGTVRPLADSFHLATEIYSDPAALAAAILLNHPGDVVLVAAHSDTVGPIANALGASVPVATISDFDNLYLVSRSGAAANVVNLQYGASSTPDLTKNSTAAATFLFVGKSAAATEPPELVQAARKSGVASIRTEGANTLVAPLAASLGLTPAVFAAGQGDTVIDGLVAGPANQVVMLAGSREMIQHAVARLGAGPTPILLPTDSDHLIAVTRFASGAARSVALRF